MLKTYFIVIYIDKIEREKNLKSKIPKKFIKN